MTSYTTYQDTQIYIETARGIVSLSIPDADDPCSLLVEIGMTPQQAKRLACRLLNAAGKAEALR